MLIGSLYIIMNILHDRNLCHRWCIQRRTCFQWSRRGGNAAPGTQHWGRWAPGPPSGYQWVPLSLRLDPILWQCPALPHSLCLVHGGKLSGILHWRWVWIRQIDRQTDWLVYMSLSKRTIWAILSKCSNQSDKFSRVLLNPFSTGTHFYCKFWMRLDIFIDIKKGHWSLEN